MLELLLSKSPGAVVTGGDVEAETVVVGAAMADTVAAARSAAACCWYSSPADPGGESLGL